MAHEVVPPMLTARQMGRYQRQMVLPEVGMAGQRQLLASRVLIVGAGALGSAAATYLAAAGVGTVGLVDGDTVELSNLHRQILHDESQIGRLKTESGAERLRAVNPDIDIQAHPDFLSSSNVLQIFDSYHLIINGSDNFPTRYLVNDAAVILNKPLIDAAILRFEGQLAVFRPGRGCYRCLFPTPPPPGSVPDCAEAGILGAVAGVLGSMQAVEALKVLLNLDKSGASALVMYDALSANWHRMPFGRDPECVVCGHHPTIVEPIDYEGFCAVTSPNAGQDIPVHRADAFSVNVEQAVRMMRNPNLTILDVRDENEFETGHVPRSHHCALQDLDEWTTKHKPDAPVLVICAVGVRSAHAATYLRSCGYDAWTLIGGMKSWLSGGQDAVL